MKLKISNKHGLMTVNNWNDDTIFAHEKLNKMRVTVPHEAPGISQSVSSLFIGFRHIPSGHLVICCFQPLCTDVDFFWATAVMQSFGGGGVYCLSRYVAVHGLIPTCPPLTEKCLNYF